MGCRRLFILIMNKYRLIKYKHWTDWRIQSIDLFISDFSYENQKLYAFQSLNRSLKVWLFK
jgi:hypothetical protein